MKIIEWHQFLDNGLPIGDNPASMTVGIFDGVHRGHKALINRIVSHNLNYVPVIVTFRQNHKTINNELSTSPQTVGLEGEVSRVQLTMNNRSRDIQSFEERLVMFEKLGIQIAVVIDFSEEFKRLPGREFLRLLLDSCNIGFFAAGSDFRCGYKLDTGAEAIQSFFASRKIPVEIIPQVMEGSLSVSSSRIRAALAQGDTALAQVMLGGRQPGF